MKQRSFGTTLIHILIKDSPYIFPINAFGGSMMFRRKPFRRLTVLPTDHFAEFGRKLSKGVENLTKTSCFLKSHH